jgi:hypothetical protein
MSAGEPTDIGAEPLRFRPADTASLPMFEDEQCYRMGEVRSARRPFNMAAPRSLTSCHLTHTPPPPQAQVIVANTGEGLGLMLTGESNMVADMHPEGPGAQGGMMVGDVILAVDDRVVTSVDWRPSEDEGVVLCMEPHALEPAGLALDHTKPSVSLKVLRPVELRQEAPAPPSLAEEMAAVRAHVPVGQEVPSPQRPPAQPTYVAEQRPPTAQERVRSRSQPPRVCASSEHCGYSEHSQHSQHRATCTPLTGVPCGLVRRRR